VEGDAAFPILLSQLRIMMRSFAGIANSSTPAGGGGDGARRGSTGPGLAVVVAVGRRGQVSPSSRRGRRRVVRYVVRNPV